MSPDDARRIVAVHLLPEHPTLEVGDAFPDRPPAEGAPCAPYTVRVTTRGIAGIVRVTGCTPDDVTPVELDGVRYSMTRAIERPAPPLFEPAT